MKKNDAEMQGKYRVRLAIDQWFGGSWDQYATDALTMGTAREMEEYAKRLRRVGVQDEDEPDLLAALKLLLEAYDSILPGIKHIAVQNYALVNDAPLAARAAIAHAEKERTT